MNTDELIPDWIKTPLQKRMVAVFAALSVALFIIVTVFDITSSVRDGYWPYAEAMASGVVPYTEDVWYHETGEWILKGWEYPPGTYLFLFIPRLVGWTEVTYETAFIAMVFVFFLLGLWAVKRISSVAEFSFDKATIIYSVTMVLMAEFLLDRMDIIPMVLTLVSLTFMVEKRYNWAFGTMAFAAVVKLYPVLLIPLLAIYLLHKKELKNALYGIVTAAVVVAVCLGITAALGTNPLDFLSYHAERHLEVESMAASILEFIDIFADVGITYEFSSGSDNISGTTADLIADYLLYIMAVTEVVLYVAYLALARKKQYTDREGFRLLMQMSLISVWLFMMVSTIFSGQYVIWLIAPLIGVLAFSDGSSNKTMFRLFVLIEVLTQLDFLVNFGMRGAGEDLNAAGILIILARNILMIALIVIVCRSIRTCGKGTGTHQKFIREGDSE